MTGIKTQWVSFAPTQKGARLEIRNCERKLQDVDLSSSELINLAHQMWGLAMESQARRLAGRQIDTDEPQEWR